MTGQPCPTCDGEQIIRVGVEFDASTGKWIYDDAVPCPDCQVAQPCPNCKGTCDVPTTDPTRDTETCWLCCGAGTLAVAS